jgi:hypothetical protein
MRKTASIFGLAIILCSVTFYACDSTESGSSVSALQLGKCNYVNIFSGLAECKQYSGSTWSEASAEEDCLAGGGSAPPEGTWLAKSDCGIDPTLGSCAVAPSDGLDYVKAIGGSDQRDCTASAHACTAFEGGTFVASNNCPGYGQAPMSGEASVATIFQWPTLSCVPALAGEPVGATNGEVCTWNLISGSTEEGRSYADYGSCEIVYTNRPYYPLEPWEEPPIEDPRYDDPAWLAESDWVASQVRSSACSCCHSDVAPLGPARWSIDLGPGWVDTMSEEGLALFAGHTDSSTLGAFDPEDNNGFDRVNSAMPTTDVFRMLAFFQGELDHRGVTNAYIQSFPDIGGPLIVQRDFVPEACGAGEGVDIQGNLVWNGGEARYLYVMSPGSDNPGLPPNLDLPAGTVWRADVLYDVPAFPSGVAYGVLPVGALQRYPESGAPEDLVSGQQYYLYVLRDVVIPLARCLFEAP